MNPNAIIFFFENWFMLDEKGLYASAFNVPIIFPNFRG